MRRWRHFILFPILLLVTACAGRFEADVSRFHRLAQPGGETIKITALDETKAGSLEFRAYSDMVAQELRRLGYRVVGPEAESELTACVDYGVGSGNTIVRSYGGYSGFGYYRHPWYYPWGPYGYYPPYYGYDREVRSYVEYPRWLVLQIVRADLSREDPEWMLFDGRVESRGKNERLNEVMPLLVQALFAEFPGPSGETTEVTIKLDESRSY